MIVEMSLNTYQKHAASTTIYPKDILRRTTNENNKEFETFLPLHLVYPTLGLCGESGEVAEKVKKAIRDKWPLHDLREAVVKELGDVLWYVAAIATDLGVTMEHVAAMNLHKLQTRKKTNTLSGSGDHRELGGEG